MTNINFYMNLGVMEDVFRKIDTTELTSTYLWFYLHSKLFTTASANLVGLDEIKNF